MGYLSIFSLCSVYILTACLTVDKTGKSVTQIIADGSIAFLVGMLINRLFDLQGIMMGEKNERVLATISLHGETVDRISPFLDHLSAWCDWQNAENYRIQRTKILARYGLRYVDCFDEEGLALPYFPSAAHSFAKKRIERRKLRGYHKAVRLKLSSLDPGELTSEGGKTDDPFYLGRTKSQFERQTNFSEILVKLGLAVLSGYYGVRLIDDFNYVNLIWTVLQVLLFVSLGAIKMYKAYLYITDEYRARVIKKIDNLQKFENFIKNQPVTVSDTAYNDASRRNGA